MRARLHNYFDHTTYEFREPVRRSLERLKWFLWHGNVYQALQMVQSVAMDLEVAVATSPDATARKLLKAVEEFHTSIRNNAGFIPNYGERYHHGERISTGFVESTVNQVVSKRMVKKQQMDHTRRPSPATDSHARVERRVGSDIPHLVSGLPVSHTPRGGLSRCTPSGVDPTEP